MRRLLLWAGCLLVLLAIFFVGDYGWLRIRAARSPGAYDTVEVQVVAQIPQKGNKAEYVPQESQTQSCVRSIFPHEGQQPCWYLRSHAQQQINY